MAFPAGATSRNSWVGPVPRAPRRRHTTVLSKKGQLVLPAEVRAKLGLRPGDDFEVLVDDDGTIRLRRISTPANAGLVQHLFSCPHPFEVPRRPRDLPRDMDLD